MQKNFLIPLLLDFYGDLLTHTQYNFVDLYYNEDLSLSEIAEHHQITRQGVRDAIKRGEAILLDIEGKLGFAQKAKTAKESIEQIKVKNQMIKQTNLAGGGNRTIARSVAEIEDLLDRIQF